MFQGGLETTLLLVGGENKKSLERERAKGKDRDRLLWTACRKDCEARLHKEG